MASFVFVGPAYHGHLGPMLALARTLVDRGHEVAFATTLDGAERVAKAEITADVVGRTTHPAGSLAAEEAAMARVRGLRGLALVVHAIAATTDMLARELPEVIKRRRATVIVHDQLEPAGALVARAQGLLQVSMANALPINRGPTVPPFFTGWPPARSAWERQRIVGAHRVADRMMAGFGDVVTRHATRLGIRGVRHSADLLSPHLDIAQMAPELEYPGLGLNRRDVGPIRTRRTLVRQPPPPRPLVYASLGTLFGGRADIFRALARATDGLGVDVLVAHGGRLTPEDVRQFPAHVRAVAWVDQAEILSRATLVLTHAGMNTALDAAAAGVPMVAVPLAFDQPGVAARIAAAGLGLVVPPGPLLARRLRRAISRLLDDDAFARRSRAIAARMAERGGASEAASAIERLLRV